MAEVNVKNLRSVELFDLYFKWIDYSIFDGLDPDNNDDDYEKYGEICDELGDKYGVECVLRPDAPPEAVAAWKEDGRRTAEANAQGYIID